MTKTKMWSHKLPCGIILAWAEDDKPWKLLRKLVGKRQIKKDGGIKCDAITVMEGHHDR